MNLNKSDIISTDEDPGLRLESSAIMKIHGVTTMYRCSPCKRTKNLFVFCCLDYVSVADVDLFELSINTVNDEEKVLLYVGKIWLFTPSNDTSHLFNN